MNYVAPQITAICHSLQGMGLGPLAINEIVATITRHIHATHPHHRPAPQPLSQIARNFLKGSIRRSEFFGQKLVADTAWNMLLDLFAAHEDGREVSVSSLCFASGSPSTTALRHLNMMVDRKLVSRIDHESDGRRVLVAITPEAHAVMRDLVLSFCINPPEAI